ncbi:hypothetical protein B0T12DRAFT_60994 [Alternaria alternata]|nr:hypothetical protein B0T12DRAFT_60994 [Alternaria alternata]
MAHVAHGQRHGLALAFILISSSLLDAFSACLSFALHFRRYHLSFCLFPATSHKLGACPLNFVAYRILLFLLLPLDAISMDTPFGFGFCFNIVACPGVDTTIPCLTVWSSGAFVLLIFP